MAAAAAAVTVATAATVFFVFLDNLNRRGMMMTVAATAATRHLLNLSLVGMTVTMATTATSILGRLDLDLLGLGLGAKTEELQHRTHPFKGQNLLVIII